MAAGSQRLYSLRLVRNVRLAGFGQQLIGELEVGIDGLDIVQIFQLFEQLDDLDGGGAVWCDGRFWLHDGVGRIHRQASGNQRILDDMQILHLGVDFDAVLVDREIIRAGVDREHGNFFRIGAIGVDRDHAHIVEHPRDAAGFSKCAAGACQHGADLSDGAIAIVGQGANDDCDAARRVALVEIRSSPIFEISYEGYAPGGIAVVIRALTDNRNRTRRRGPLRVGPRAAAALGETGSWVA